MADVILNCYLSLLILTAMLLKPLFTASYSEMINKETVNLQKMNVETSIAKNHLIFSER